MDRRRLWLARTLIWVACLAPLGWVVWAGVRGELGPDPGKALVDHLGLWALRLLLITLAMTPLRAITGVALFIQVRRLIGLFAWFYATVHLSCALFYVIGLSSDDILRALSERTYVILGAIAWLMLLALALTSTRASQRRLGRRWRQLHRLIYPAAILAVAHFAWLVRSDFRQPAIYGLILVFLLGWRVWFARAPRRRG